MDETRKMAHEIKRAIADNKPAFIGCTYPQEIKPEMLRALISPDMVVRGTAQIDFVRPIIDDCVAQLNAVYELAHKAEDVAKAPLKNFYELDEPVPGGRHEVRLLYANGKPVGRFLVPMDGEWVSSFDVLESRRNLASTEYMARQN